MPIASETMRVKDFVFEAFCRTGGDRLVWGLDRHRLRILCYHGICDDHLVGQPWLPDFFVTASAFERQLRYLRRHARVLPLDEATRRLRDGTLPPQSVSITFDDGYANNLYLACPLLVKYGLPATFFLSSAYMESGEFFPFLKLNLIRLHGAPKSLLDYKSNPIDRVTQEADRWWPMVRQRLSDSQLATLRPLSVDEVRRIDSPLIELGAHSHTHCILSNETAARRQHEIQISIGRVAQWTGRPVRLFSYPNGQRGDFGEIDKQALRAAGIAAAVSGIAGANGRRSDLLELRRYPVGIAHDNAGFCAEVTGFRTALLRSAGRLTYEN
jgi:peptidoglycan/xylan/chitin deacetylase (PgdA/CDA1 family)